MQRVMIVGQPGSGKSTLARLLGDKTGLPVFHMDHIHWMAGWQPRPDGEKRAMVAEIEAKDRWILEGGFSATYASRRARADTLIILDISLWLRLFRVSWRFVRDYGRTRPDMADGCPEGNWTEMVGFYRFIWRTRHTSRARILGLREPARAGLDVHVLTSRVQVNRYLEATHA